MTKSRFKVTVVGQSNVGKTSLIIMLVSNHFVVIYDPGIEDIYFERFKIDSEMYEMDIIDTYGTNDDELNYFKYHIMESDGFVVQYSITSKESFNDVPNSINTIMMYKQIDDISKIPVVIVGNKTDLEKDRAVSTDDGQNLAEKYNSPFIEISVKMKIGVRDVFEKLLEIMIFRENKNRKTGEMKQNKDKLNTMNTEKNKKTCLLL
ncbi:hypothetical protein EIN_220070 [Entamoeba invadens IP1]|uniref:small monomeric GTPase n=1 Tax=Entamoeba invadens IP1 TaxID=370355 RepID=L7FMR8_ENTIV|nr:hypothetical protein EIN_220070 [Entamoeba invadens IP1]ELP89545.1 hypothetical protein EIN_220070 [Entamoeba invadens IP1]|eukprot:XP_004256316.1 hypothetical protein EIN_220070 [Entamoeba invadens IP1]